MTLRQREEVPGLSRDRADLILAGAVILDQLMRRGRFSSITVSGQGLREGLFYEQFLVGETPPLFSDQRGFSVQNLARIYNYEPLHTGKVRDLSLSLFDQLRPLHGYGEWERDLLGAPDAAPVSEAEALEGSDVQANELADAVERAVAEVAVEAEVAAEAEVVAEAEAVAEVASPASPDSPASADSPESPASAK